MTGAGHVIFGFVGAGKDWGVVALDDVAITLVCRGIGDGVAVAFDCFDV